MTVHFLKGPWQAGGSSDTAAHYPRSKLASVKLLVDDGRAAEFVQTVALG
jgi:hypothetical protein